MGETITVAAGQRFRVTKVHEVRTEKGRLRARYHPTHPETGDPLDYAVTLVNIKIVAELVRQGIAVIETARDARRANALRAGLAKIKGTAIVKPKRKKG